MSLKGHIYILFVHEEAEREGEKERLKAISFNHRPRTLFQNYILSAHPTHTLHLLKPMSTGCVYLLAMLPYFLALVILVILHIYTFLLPIALGFLLLPAASQSLLLPFLTWLLFLLLFPSSSRNGFRFGLGRALLVFEHYFSVVSWKRYREDVRERRHRTEEEKKYFVVLNIERSFARLL